MKKGSCLGGILLILFLVGGVVAAEPVFLQEEQEEKAQEKKQPAKATKKKKSSGREPVSETNTRRLISRVLRNFTDGIERQSPSSLRDTVDRDKFFNFPRFEDGVTNFLRSLGEMRIFTRQSDVQIKDDRAVMIIDAEMVIVSRTDPSRRETRRQRITFDFQRTDHGWKITEIKPRSFFLP